MRGSSMVYILVELEKRTMHSSTAPSLGLLWRIGALFLAPCAGWLYLCLFICKCHWKLRSYSWKSQHQFFRDCCEAVPYAGLACPWPSLSGSQPSTCDMRTWHARTTQHHMLHVKCVRGDHWLPGLCSERVCSPTCAGGDDGDLCLLAFKMVLGRFKVKNNPTPYDLGLLHPGVAPMLSAWISKSWYSALSDSTPCILFVSLVLFLDFPTWA